MTFTSSEVLTLVGILVALGGQGFLLVQWVGKKIDRQDDKISTRVEGLHVRINSVERESVTRQELDRALAPLTERLGKIETGQAETLKAIQVVRRWCAAHDAATGRRDTLSDQEI